MPELHGVASVSIHDAMKECVVDDLRSKVCGSP